MGQVNFEEFVELVELVELEVVPGTWHLAGEGDGGESAAQCADPRLLRHPYHH